MPTREERKLAQRERLWRLLMLSIETAQQDDAVPADAIPRDHDAEADALRRLLEDPAPTEKS
jgi:hypothetical protein